MPFLALHLLVGLRGAGSDRRAPLMFRLPVDRRVVVAWRPVISGQRALWALIGFTGMAMSGRCRCRGSDA